MGKDENTKTRFELQSLAKDDALQKGLLVNKEMYAIKVAILEAKYVN
jgi:hypothetical protein